MLDICTGSSIISEERKFCIFHISEIIKLGINRFVYRLFCPVRWWGYGIIWYISALIIAIYRIVSGKKINDERFHKYAEQKYKKVVENGQSAQYNTNSTNSNTFKTTSN